MKLKFFTLACILTFNFQLSTFNCFAQLCFYPHVEYSPCTNTNTKNITTGDFNNDNVPDLAVAVVTPSLVSIMLNDGSGAFPPANTYTAACNTQPYAICSADFNNDTKADVAVANNGTFQGMSVMLGNGAGALGAPTSYAAGTNPAGITCGYFNNDGNVDIAVTNFNNVPGTISVYMGNGTGTFAAAVTYTVGTGTNPCGIVCKDVNNDTKADLVTSNVGTDNITVFLNNGSGGFFSAGSFTVGASTDPRDLTLCDLNVDGKPDVVTCNNATSNVTVLLGQGTGQFLGPNSYLAGNSPWGITSADFSGDGIDDVAVSNLSSSNVSVLRGDGVGGLFTTQNFASGTGSVKVAAADFNMDGKKDLATANQNIATDNISILLNARPGPIVITGNATVCSGSPATLTAAGASSYVWASGPTTSSITVSPTGNTTYSVTGTNASCTITATGSTSVTVNPLPIVTANATTVSAGCSGTSTTLTGGGASSYIWSGGVSNGIGFLVSATTTYTVTGTDLNTCSNTATITLGVDTVPPAPSLCLVTVDSLSDYNIIAWEKSPGDNVDSFLVYREISTNNYQPIAAIPYDSLSLFIDTVRTKYFPNTGDPNAGTYRYKIGVRDTCGYYSPLADYHNTIFIINNAGTFSWPQLYTIENNSNPVTSYLLLRDDSSNGNWQAVASVAGTQQTVSDPLYSQYQNVASWRVETQWGINCNSTIKDPSPMATNLHSSKSNIYKVGGPTSVVDAAISGSVKIYPNPTNGIFVIAGPAKQSQLEIYNVMGEKVYSSMDNGQGLMANGTNTSAINHFPLTIDISSQPAGVYFLHLDTENGRITKKIVLVE